MAANMLTAYYSKGADSKELFAPYKISQAEGFEKHLNKYNVISFDMQKFLVKTKSVEEMLEFIEKKLIRDINKEYSEFIEQEDDLISVFENIYMETGIPFVFIMDEWDCVLRYYNSESEQKKYLDYLYALFKGQPYVALAYMTGILPIIKKYGVHSALNMFTEVSMTNTRNFSEFTGLTQQEVSELCEKYDMDINLTKKWYDGYNVHGIDI